MKGKPLLVAALASCLFTHPLTGEDRVFSLIKKLQAGESLPINQTDEQEFLKDLLSRLDVPVASQVLVFSKTSMQKSQINPRHPARALFFRRSLCRLGARRLRRGNRPRPRCRTAFLPDRTHPRPPRRPVSHPPRTASPATKEPVPATSQGSSCVRFSSTPPVNRFTPQVHILLIMPVLWKSGGEGGMSPASTATSGIWETRSLRGFATSRKSSSTAKQELI